MIRYLTPPHPWRRSTVQPSCDATGCHATGLLVFCGLHGREDRDDVEARTTARRLGWAFVAGMDYCPEHRETR